MEELKNTLVTILNASTLPLDAKYYIIKDLYRDIHEFYYSELEKLKQKGSEENVAELAKGVQPGELDKLPLDRNTTQSDQSE